MTYRINEKEGLYPPARGEMLRVLPDSEQWQRGSLPSEPEWFQQKPARKPTVIQAAVSLVLTEKNERI